LDVHGKASVVETDEPSGELLTWFQRQLDGWVIIPGDRGPLASSTQKLAMLVRVENLAQINGSYTNSVPETHWAVSSFVLVNIAASGPAVKERVTVNIGGMRASQRSMPITE